MKPQEKPAVNAERSWPALIFATLGAIRHALTRRIRGQRTGERAEQSWRDSDDDSPGGELDGAGGQGKSRKKLERFT